MPSPPAPAARLIRLKRQIDIDVLPPPQESSAFAPFTLWPIPLSQVCWVRALTKSFFGKQGRCLAGLLMIDCLLQRWDKPLLPTQQCRPDGSTWSLKPQDFDGIRTDLRIAGSFQMGPASSGAEVECILSFFDGLHLYYSLSPDI